MSEGTERTAHLLGLRETLIEFDGEKLTIDQIRHEDDDDVVTITIPRTSLEAFLSALGEVLSEA